MKKLNVVLFVFSILLFVSGGAVLGATTFLFSPAEDGQHVEVNSPVTDDPIIDEEYTYEIRDINACLEDYGVPTLLADTTITGTGSEIDPYQINSTNDFIYFFTRMSGIYLKSISINCDIYLNDETFNEDGVPSGGDGIVYKWCYYTSTIKNVEGNGHTIFGLYLNDEDTSHTFTSLFGTLYEIKNINLFDFYVKGESKVAPLVYRNLLLIENVVTRGYVDAGTKLGTGGIVFSNSSIVKNCESYTKILNGQYSGGIAAATTDVYSSEIKSFEFINCKNYGDVSATWTNGGILGYTQTPFPIKIVNCINYGNMYDTNDSSGNNVGGIAGAIYANDCKLDVVNCKNYGNHVGGGVISLFEGKLTINNFENFGLKRTNSQMDSELVNTLRANVTESVVNIKNIKIQSREGLSICGQRGASVGVKKLTINFENISIDFSKTKTKPNGILILGTSYNIQETVVNVSNVNIVDNSEETSLALFYVMGQNTTINIKNVNANINCNKWSLDYTFIKNASLKEGVKINIRSIIVSLKVGGENQSFYYGDDFEDFYVSWRSGKVGLTGLDGRGFFQGAIDEEWLEREGYEKRYA